MTPPLTLLDGGTGRELRRRGVRLSDRIWSASALLSHPEVVRRIHLDYALAGAEVLTTNTYGVLEDRLADEGLEGQLEALIATGCRLAREAREQSGRAVRLAGSLPPLRGSYRPDRVGPFEEIEPLYRRHAEAHAPWVDLLLCETLSTVGEALAAATAACATGLPVWVSWTLSEDEPGRLRSGETLAEALAALAPLPVAAFLVNCCAPEQALQAMPALQASGRPFGAYANTFRPVPPGWRLADGVLPLRADLEPAAYADHAARWRAAGASLIGGCCGTGPAHVAALRERLS